MSTEKKIYRMTFMEDYEVVLEVDRTILTDEKLLEYLNYWSGAEHKIKEAGTPLKAYLTMLCAAIMRESTESFDVENAFHLDRVEGFPSLSGEFGITLIDYDEFEFLNNHVVINEETDDAGTSPQQ